MDEPFIFGIGMNKTGTVSLTRALDVLGFPCLHDSVRVSKVIEENQLRKRPILHSLTDEYRAFCDCPIPLHFEVLDITYPGSRFIFTMRSKEAWIKSRMIQFGDTRQYHSRCWDDHCEAVARYFKGREDDILVYHLCDGVGWVPLCEFLGVPVPDQPFPWKNKTTPYLRRRRRRALKRRGLA